MYIFIIVIAIAEAIAVAVAARGFPHPKTQSDRKGNMQPNEIAANVIVRLPAVVANNVCWL